MCNVRKGIHGSPFLFAYGMLIMGQEHGGVLRPSVGTYAICLRPVVRPRACDCLGCDGAGTDSRQPIVSRFAGKSGSFAREGAQCGRFFAVLVSRSGTFAKTGEMRIDNAASAADREMRFIKDVPVFGGQGTILLMRPVRGMRNGEWALMYALTISASIGSGAGRGVPQASMV